MNEQGPFCDDPIPVPNRARSKWAPWSFARCESVGPMILLQRLMASGPTSSMATIGPLVMNSTNRLEQSIQ